MMCGHKSARVDVIGIGQLLGYLQYFPSLCLELNGRSDSAFQTVDTWAGRAEMQSELKLADPQKKFIEELQALIRGSEHQHCRVIGEPGLGKTRIVLEAISAVDIRPSTIYVATGEDLQHSALFNELLKNDREYSVNLVVDDCDEKDRASIWGGRSPL
jgi:predicted ATP-dependent serine protease